MDGVEARARRSAERCDRRAVVGHEPGFESRL